MRRSLAPSQILKQSQKTEVPSTPSPGGKRRCVAKKRRYKDSDSDDDNNNDDGDGAESSSPLIRSPLTPLLLNSPTGSLSPSDAAEYERLIQKILSRPFKIPIKNYQGPVGTKCLGYRKNGARRPLHDPEEEGALILWAPPELSASEVLTIKEDQMQVGREFWQSLVVVVVAT